MNTAAYGVTDYKGTSRRASSSANTFLNSGMLSGSRDSTSARAPSFPVTFITYTKPL
uniref:Uncharacterized protein n=1 Tax=Arundo donax TaxID=35708 RepID=A0A0A9GIC2_ARUDO